MWISLYYTLHYTQYTKYDFAIIFLIFDIIYYTIHSIPNMTLLYDKRIDIDKDGPIVEDRALGIYPNSMYTLYTCM